MHSSYCVWHSLTLPFSTLVIERFIASSKLLPPVIPPMTRMESRLIETTVVQALGDVSEAIFFQELLGTSNTLISAVVTPCIL